MAHLASVSFGEPLQLVEESTLPSLARLRDRCVCSHNLIWRERTFELRAMAGDLAQLILEAPRSPLSSLLHIRRIVSKHRGPALGHLRCSVPPCGRARLLSAHDLLRSEANLAG